VSPTPPQQSAGPGSDTARRPTSSRTGRGGASGPRAHDDAPADLIGAPAGDEPQFGQAVDEGSPADAPAGDAVSEIGAEMDASEIDRADLLGSDDSAGAGPGGPTATPEPAADQRGEPADQRRGPDDTGESADEAAELDVYHAPMVVVPNETVERRADKGGETIYSAAPPPRVRAAGSADDDVVPGHLGETAGALPHAGAGALAGADAGATSHDVPVIPAADAPSFADPPRADRPPEVPVRRPVTRRARRTPIADSALEPGAAPSRGERVGAALRVWRGDLAQTGGPNALLWYRDTPDGTLDLTKAHPTGVSMLMAGNRVRLSHLVREPAAFREALGTARRIRNKALELHDDHGLDAGYVCVGMATWQLPGTHRRPQAPIMLRSARLHAVDGAETDLEMELSTRVEINPVFLHYMASEQGVRLKGEALADLAHSTGRFDPLPVYRELRRVLAGVADFTIVDRRVISTFAMSKMAMVADLAAFADILAGNDVIAALAGDPNAEQALRADGDGGLADSDRRPAEPDLARESLVLDADPSQQDVIDAARSGRHVLLDAARGTGTTQTLANIAAALVAGDQRVLVVSESARQLADFTAYLDRAGLSELVLDARDPHELRRTISTDIIARVEGRRIPPGSREEGYGERGADPASGAAGDRESLTDPGESGPRDLDGRGGREESDGREGRDGTDGAASSRTHAALSPEEEALATVRRARPDDEDSPHRELARLRARLAGHSQALHAPREPWGVSIFEAQTALAALSAHADAPTSRVRIPPEALRRLTRDGMRQLAHEAAQVAADGAWTTAPGDEDPWWGAQLPTPEDAELAVAIAADLAGGRLAADRDVLDAALADAGLPPGRSVEDWHEALSLVAGVRDTLMAFRPEVYSRDLEPLIAATDPATEARSSWWARGSSHKKEARALALPHARIDSLHEALRRAHDQRERWVALTGRDDEPRVPEKAAEALARCVALEKDVAWLDVMLAGASGGSALMTLPIDRLQARLAQLAARADRADVVPAVRERLARLAQAGLGEFLRDLAHRHVAPERVVDEAEFVWWLSVLDAVAGQDPAYGSHDRAALHDLVREFVTCDRALHAGRAQQVLQRARAHARVEASTRPDQVNVLRDAAAYDRLPRPTRALLAECGEVVAAVAPIWVMSPLTLASVVPTHLAFDAVLIDDAGRMPVAHAVSALARAVRVVAAGDLQGLGPRHFETVAPADDVDEDDDAPAAYVSVLEALSAYLPLRHLTCAYGERDARLVSFAVGQREEEARAWPTPRRGTALRLLRTGAVISSVDQIGEAEARENSRVVDVVVEHLRQSPQSSLAVLAITPAQAAELDRHIRHALTRDAQAAAAPVLAEGADERLLVTTVDRAAGTTRDTVVFATGLMPLPGMRLRAPERLHHADGDRLVDTVVGIARHRLDIVSALTARDMAQIPAASAGQVRMAQLLEHAERDGYLGSAPDDDDRHALLRELAGRLRSEGLTVHEGYGVGEARIDLAVEEPYVPGKVVVAVHSDGARHAAVATVRERERLGPEQLDRLGWRTVRVWSTDVFRDPARDVARIVDAARAGG
jgi:very-short-patch-repair endonuclease